MALISRRPSPSLFDRVATSSTTSGCQPASTSHWSAVSRGGAGISHPQVGVYVLTFNRSLQDCAIAVTPVASAVLPFDSYTTFSVNGADLTVVTNRQNDNQRSDSGFHAIAIC